MESIFQNIGARQQSPDTSLDDDFIGSYEYRIKAMIADAADYNDSYLSPQREENLKFYNGDWPPLEPVTFDDGLEGDPMPPDEEELDNRSHAVSTDVRDTVMAILPSLVRIFCSTEKVATFIPNGQDQVQAAQQATEVVDWTFWNECDGFLLLHDVFKDALIEKVGVVRWWTETSAVMRQKHFANVTIANIQAAIEKYNQASPDGTPIVSVTKMTPPRPDGTVEEVTLQYIESTPRLCVESVPPENFRIDRRARRVKQSRLVGYEELISLSDAVEKGVEYDVAVNYIGEYNWWSVEQSIRNPATDISTVQNDLVIYGEYFIYIDSDGDGIDELHQICTIGGDYDIISDEIVDAVNFAVFCGDPIPHTVIGDAIADLVKDIQTINTQILRGSLDSLSQSLYSDLVINQLTTNVTDVMADGVGRIIRTTGDPNASVKEFKREFVGPDAFNMMSTMDAIRQRRTGISEASKGIDPKALQSTNVMGVDAIVTGAQERIELIARIFAETGLRDVWQGMLRELTQYPNRAKSLEINGKWVEYDLSVFDPNMKVKVNPTMGKGSDMNRLMVLQTIMGIQKDILTTYGMGNPYVHPSNFMNTVSDIAAIGNVKDITRYFNPVTEEQEQQIINAPKEPTPEEIVARSTMEEVRSKTAKAIGEQQQRATQAKADEDFRRDKLTLDTVSKLAIALAKTDLSTIESSAPFVEQENSRNA
jgi:hypothetical protein